jgi:hypothetical protein
MAAVTARPRCGSLECFHCRERTKSRLNEAGGTTTSSPTSTLDPKALARHAEKFGIDGVLETAVETGIAGAELARLKLKLRIVAENHRHRRKLTKHPESWYESPPAITDEDLVALAGKLTVDEVAALTGLSRSRVTKAVENATPSMSRAA